LAICETAKYKHKWDIHVDLDQHEVSHSR
jgi:hypothetical protein